jgi:hypothetical protein
LPSAHFVVVSVFGGGLVSSLSSPMPKADEEAAMMNEAARARLRSLGDAMGMQ